MRKLILLLSYIAIASSGAMAQTFVVTSNGGDCNGWSYSATDDPTPGDNLSGTLGEAIYRHRSGDNITRIEFDASLDGQVSTCTGQAFFEINQPNLTIDASNVDYTISAGSGQTFKVVSNNVTIIGLNLQGGGTGVYITGNNVTIQDMSISGMTSHGIQTENASDFVIDNNTIFNNQGSGVLVTGGTGGVVENNVIGLDEDGNIAPNGQQNDTQRSTGANGWVSLNNNAGKVSENGINVSNVTQISILNNVVSGNDGHAINISGVNSTTANPSLVNGNNVGVSEDHSEVIGNFGHGIYFRNSSNFIVSENHVAGNGNAHIFLPGDITAYQNMMGIGIDLTDNSQNIEVIGNTIGTDISGNNVTVGGVNFGNNFEGIQINNAFNNTIGGRLDSERNVIGGNGYGFKDLTQPYNGLPALFHGINIQNGSQGNEVKGNFLGLGKDLTSDVANAVDQISIQAFSTNAQTNSNIIGGDDIADANYIAGGEAGVHLQASDNTTEQVSNNQILNNFFATSDITGTPTNNFGDAAIILNNAVGNLVGDENKPNYIIATNGAVELRNAKAERNTIRGNVMMGNTVKGINLNGVANNNFGPVYINTAELTATTAHVLTPNIGDRIDIYIADETNGNGPCQGSGQNPQGLTWVGSETSVDALNYYADINDGAGYFEIDITKYAAQGLTKDNIIVTATDIDTDPTLGGNTSEFNSCITKLLCEEPTSITLSSNTDKVICEGETTTINFSAVWPTSEVGEEHHYYLYKYDDYTTPVDTIISSDNSFPKTFTVSDSGYYKVQAANPENVGLCSKITSDSVRIRVGEIPTPDNIVASNSNDVCEDDLGKVYKVDSFEPGSTFIWNVEGASINGPSNRDSVIIDFDGGAGTIKLWVKEVSGTPFGCQSTDSTLLEIDVNPLPTPVIVAPNASECAADTIVYRVDNADPNSNFNWTITGGSELSSAEDSIEVIWGTGVSGSVTVEETTDAGCIATSSTTTITINSRPVEPILTNTGSICTLDDFTAEISNPGNRTFEWEITGGTPLMATGNSVTITADANPTDSIRINIISTTTNGCSSIDPAYFAIGLNQRPVPGDISINPGLEACEADTITVSYNTSSSSVTPVWSSSPASFLANNAIGAYQGKESFQVVVAESASISVREVSSDNCGTNPDSVKTVNFIMNANPVAPTLSGPTSVTCADSSIVQTYSVDNFESTSTYDWSFNNVETSNVTADGSSADLTFGRRSYTIKVVETSDKGCSSDSASQTVNVVGCVFEAAFELSGGGTEICFDNINGVDFTDKSEGVIPGSTSYLWDFDLNSDATSSPATSTDTNPTGVIYNSAGTYTVRLIIEDFIQGVALKDTADIEITVHELPSITSISGPDELCEGDSGIFSITETVGSSYSWTFPSEWVKYDESNPADSVSIEFPRSLAQSGDISVTEVDSNMCELTLTKSVTVNTAPISGGIISADTDKCEGDTVTLEYDGPGDSYRWKFSGTTDATFVNQSTTNTIDVVLGENSATVQVFATSSEGCFSLKENDDSTLTPTELPDLSNYQILGPGIICENDTAIYTVSPIEAGITYEWQQRAHKIIGSTTSDSIYLVTNFDESKIAVVLSNDGCTNTTPLESDVIYEIEIPDLPNISTLANKYCEDSTVLISYNSIDTLMYNWTVTPDAGKQYLTSNAQVGLDELIFSVNSKNSWPSGIDCPELNAQLIVGFNNIPELNTCKDTLTIPINVDFRIENSSHSVSVEDLGTNGFGYICNLFDSRADSSGLFKANWDCEADTRNDLSFIWEISELKDIDNDGVVDTVQSPISDALSNNEYQDFDLSKAPITENREYKFYMEYTATNSVCANDVATGTGELILEASDTVDFALEDRVICEEDSSFIEVVNLENSNTDSELIYTYYRNLDTLGASYGYVPPYVLRIDTISTNPIVVDTVYSTEGFTFTESSDSYYYEAYNGFLVDKDSANYLNSLEETVMYGKYIIPNSMIGDSIQVHVQPRYCVVNDSIWQDQFTDSLKLNVVNRPGGVIGGIDYGTSTDFRGLTRDELIAENPNGVFPEELNLSQLEDNYVLLDAAENRDTNFVYASNNMIYYGWAYLESDEYQAIDGEHSNVLIDKPNGMPEEINYAMITSQIATGNDTVCTDTSYYKITFEYIPWVPNIFSPNGDGNHDLFEIRNVEMYPETKVQIFNRWGSHLITIDYYDNANHVWDGKVNGKDVSTGTYYYLVDFNVEGIDPISGSVSIIR